MQAAVVNRDQNRMPIVYSSLYDIQIPVVGGLIHKDLMRSRNVFRALARQLGLTRDTVHDAPLVSIAQWGPPVHQRGYADHLVTNPQFARGLAGGLNNKIYVRWVITPLLTAAHGSILAVDLALKHRWAVNVGGGFSQASYARGGTQMSPVADVSACVHRVRNMRPAFRILVIDLGSAQCVGPPLDFADDRLVSVLDVFNVDMAGGDDRVAAATRHCHPVREGTADHAYMLEVNRALASAIHTPGDQRATDSPLISMDPSPATVSGDSACRRSGARHHLPDFVIYCAGYDCLESDVGGGLSLSPGAVAERDLAVFGACVSHDIPFCVLLGAGYAPTTSLHIARSLSSAIKTCRLDSAGALDVVNALDL
jgi:histone deacetylase 11